MIPENIKQLANKVRNEIYGRDVRESIAQSMEVSGETSNEANERSKDTDARQTDVENRFDDQIAGNTDIDEVIDARRPEGGEAYPTLRKRLDDEHEEVTAQLEQTSYIAFYKETEDYGETIQKLYDTIPEGGTLKLEYGQFEYSQPLLLNRKVNVEGGETILIYTGSSDVAFEVGHSSGLYLNLPSVSQKTLDWSLNKIGVRINNLYSSLVILNSVRNFGRGVVIDGTDRVGNSYNKYFITQLWNNKESLVITSSNGGWSNENMFFGGRFSWTSDLDSTEGNTHILIDYVDYSNNNNKFYGCSLENAGDGLGYAIRENGGRVNSFYDFRYEGARKIFISSTTYYATISNGYDLLIENVEDNGSATTIQTSDKVFLNKSKGTLLKNNMSNSRTVLELMNSVNDIVMSFYGNGNFSTDGIGYIKKGIELYSQSDSQKRSISVYNGDPEGEVTANQGSLIMDRQGNLYIKSYGMETNTGWKKVLTETRS